MSDLKSHIITNFNTIRGVKYNLLDISYKVFGKPLHSAPIVLVNHALTGNSTVTGENGWWNEIVGDQKVIDTEKYTVISIDILGNGINDSLIENYSDFSLKDIAKLHNDLLEKLDVTEIFACVGGSIGGGLGWELSVLKPYLIKYLIPIASHWRASDWIIAHNSVQENILSNSIKPLEDARKMAMLFYRTPQSFAEKFNLEKENGTSQFKVESWLAHHGKTITDRFRLQAYRMVNHLLSTINITEGKHSFIESVQQLKSTIIQIGIDTDLFFVPQDNRDTKVLLDKAGIPNEYHEIKSIHGHDAFLIEHDQLTQILKPIFN
jgi:homoserine O-acetyltransferase